MKKNILLSALVLGMAGSAYAADGTITFNGSVTADTCTINGSSTSGAADQTVNLPTVSINALSAAGQTAGATPFSLELTKCDTDINKVMTHFEPGPAVDTSTGRLKNLLAAGAQNVQIGLLSKDMNPIVIGDDKTSPSFAVTGNGDARGAKLDYFAQYVATGAATQGAVNTYVMFTMVYS